MVARRLDDCHMLEFDTLHEPEDGGLVVIVREMAPQPLHEPTALPTELRAVLKSARAVEHRPGHQVFELSWPSYVGYAVENESYAGPLAGMSGRLLRMGERTACLDYLSKVTIASADYPGPTTHYAIICADHLINVAAQQPPRIVLRQP